MMGLVFTLGGQQGYILPIDQIREVVVSQPLSRIPGSHSAVAGMFHLRGQVVPVLNTRSVIENVSDSPCESGKVIICELNNALFGLAIGEAREVLLLDESERRATQQGSQFVSNLWLRGEQDAATMMIELNARALFSHVEGGVLPC